MTAAEKTKILSLTHGDITLLQLKEGGLVNPSNTGLILNSGVSESIARRAGPFFQQQLHMERSKLPNNRLELGQVVDTDAGQLAYKRLLHVALVGRKKLDEKLVLNSIISTYDKAEELQLPELAFPALGVGIGKFPLEAFIKLFWQITLEELPRSESLQHVILCLAEEAEFDAVCAFAEENADDVPETVRVEITRNTMWQGLV